MKYKFIKTLLILVFSSLLNIAWFWDSEGDSQAKRQQNIEEAIKISQSQLFESNTKGAIETLQNAYSKYGETLRLCETLAYAFSQSQQYASAAIYFEKAFKLSENNLILLLNAGRAYEQCKAFDSALSVYERYLKINPKDANIWKEIAILLEKQKSYQDSLNAYMKFLKNAGRNPNTVEACEIAKLFLKVKNTTQAKAWFTSALEACDASNLELKSEILAGLIDIALASSDMESLEKHQVSLEKINPQFLKEKYPLLQGQINDYKKKLEEAKNALAEAKRIEEEKAIEAKRIEEEKAAQKKKEEEAQAKLLEEEAKKEAVEVVAVEVVAEPQPETQVKDDKADAKVELQAESQVDSQPDVGILAILDPDAAEKNTQNEQEKSLIDAPKSDIGSKIFECRKLLEENKLNDAENLAQEITAQNPKSSRAWAMLARVYKAQNMSIDAFLAAKQAQNKDKLDVNARLLRIQIGSELESEKDFLKNLLEANKDFPECPPILVALARTYAYFGDTKESQKYYSQFLEFTSKKDPLYANVLNETSSLETAVKLDIKSIAKDLEL